MEAPTLALEALGRRMNVMGGSSESPFPRNVGLLFFNDEPHRFFPATQIDVVFFPDGAGGDRFEEKIFRGPLGRITREAIEYVERNHFKETVIKHSDRPEAERFWNFPREAVEEAIVNAVYHRSYAEREPVEVRISAHLCGRSVAERGPPLKVADSAGTYRAVPSSRTFGVVNPSERAAADPLTLLAPPR